MEIQQERCFKNINTTSLFTTSSFDFTFRAVFPTSSISRSICFLIAAESDTNQSIQQFASDWSQNKNVFSPLPFIADAFVMAFDSSLASCFNIRQYFNLSNQMEKKSVYSQCRTIHSMTPSSFSKDSRS